MEKDWGEYQLKLYDSNDKLKHQQESTNFLDGHALAKEWEEKEDGNIAVLLRVLYHTNEKKKWDYTPDETDK